LADKKPQTINYVTAEEKEYFNDIKEGKKKEDHIDQKFPFVEGKKYYKKLQIYPKFGYAFIHIKND
jgi:hypothetical protein